MKFKIFFAFLFLFSFSLFNISIIIADDKNNSNEKPGLSKENEENIKKNLEEGKKSFINLFDNIDKKIKKETNKKEKSDNNKKEKN
ncbi:MAG: hypothetical protein OEZ22_03555 [Spirochaetia bacterium]|nr:hypothetical protein [Spirochaetia bacterium]